MESKKIKTKGELKGIFEGGVLDSAAFKCQVCEKSFSCENELTAHEINHMKLTCGLCNKDFKTMAALANHEKNHPKSKSGAKNPQFVCPVCNKKFKNEQQCNYHQMFHTEDEIRKCEEEAKKKKEKNEKKLLKGSKAAEKPPKKLPKQKKVESDSEEEQSKEDVKTDPVVSNKKGKTKTLEKLSCGDCKKKFFDFSALEYHRIHQHASFAAIEITPVARNSPKNDTFARNSSKNDPVSKNPPKNEPVSRNALKTDPPKKSTNNHDKTDSSNIPETNSKTTKIQQTVQRDCRVTLSKDSPVVQRPPLPSPAPFPPIYSRTTAKAVELLSQQKSKIELLSQQKSKIDLLSQQKSKKSIYSDLSSSEDSCLDDSQDDPITKKRKKVEKLVTTLKKRKIEDMNDKELPFVTPKNEKVSCHLCGRTLINQGVLDYHVIHCTGGKRKNSRDSMDSLLNGVSKENDKNSGPVIEDISEDGVSEVENDSKIVTTKKDIVKPVNTKMPIMEDISEDSGEEISEENEDVSDDDFEMKNKLKVNLVKNGNRTTKKRVNSREQENLERNGGRNSKKKVNYNEEEDLDGFSDVTNNLVKPKQTKVKDVKKVIKSESDGLQRKGDRRGIAVTQIKGDKRGTSVTHLKQTKVEAADDDDDENMEQVEVCSGQHTKIKSEIVNNSSVSQKVNNSSVSKKVIKDDLLDLKERKTVPKNLVKPKVESEEESDEETEEEKVRRTLLSKSKEKFQCDICRRNFKNSSVLMYHQIHCQAAPIKSESPAYVPELGAPEPVFTSQKKSPTHDSRETCKICGISMEQKNKLLKHIRECHDVTISVKKLDDKTKKNKLKERFRCRYCNMKLDDKGELILHESDHYNPNSSCFLGNKTDADGSPIKSQKIHPNARHGVEFVETEDFDVLLGRKKKRSKKVPIFDSFDNLLKKKKRSKKDKKDKKKKKKSKKKRHASSSSESEEEEKKKEKKPRKSRFAVDFTSSSKVVEMKPVNSDDDEEVELYCYCRQPESLDMIGCDFCTEWFHPKCISLDEGETDDITKTSAWMCPECIEREAKEEAESDVEVKKKRKKRGRPKKQTKASPEIVKTGLNASEEF